MPDRIETGHGMGSAVSPLALAFAFAAAALLSPAKADDVIRIGAPLALTGALADEGHKQQVVYKMWQERVNAAGGIQVGDQKLPVQIVEYDYQSDGPRAGQLAERLITSDRVHLMMSPFGSGHTVITATVGERYQIPTVACVASSESVFAQGNPYLFGTLAPNANVTDIMVTYLKREHPELRTIAVLGRDDVFPKAMAEGAVASAKRGDLEVVYEALYPVGTVDHSAALSGIAASQPDWIYITGYSQDLILARRQMVDLGIEAAIVTMVTGPAYAEFTEALGGLANGITSPNWWHHATNYESIGPWPTTFDFYQDYLASTGGGSDPDYVHGSCAGALVMLEDVLARAGSLDGEAIRDALAATDITTIYGEIKFGDNGMNVARELPIIQVQNEKIEVLYPDSIKTSDLELMKK